MVSNDGPLLSVRNLYTYFYTYSGVVKALDGVDLDIYRNEIVGLVGETGCGKSLTALSMMRLVDRPGKIVDGEIWFKGENLLQKSEKEMTKIRGKDITMVFQDPTTYLNPVYTVGTQIGEVIKLHQDLASKDKKKVLQQKIVEALKLVKMPDPERMVKRYPHELSTGMRQRVMIGMMVSCSPELLIADEATTALDVTTQAQILELLVDLTKQLSTSVLIITHDLGIVAETCQRVYVMYAGNVVESAEKNELFDNPLHPYTVGLLKSVPIPYHDVERLATIPGFVPDLIFPPSGCRFHPRCSHAKLICKEEKPLKVKVGPNHYVSCHLIND